MVFEYEFDPEVDWNPMPTVSPADYDAGVENPTGLWENDCTEYTKKECQGMSYYGG
jgi:hypothetical protein